MEKIKCRRCGEEFDAKTGVIHITDNDEAILFCKHCGTAFGFCAHCENGDKCEFYNNPDPLPKFVVIQERHQTPNGYTIFQRQVPNTERLKKYCLGGKCSCANEQDPENPFCCKLTGEATCANYKEIECGTTEHLATTQQSES